VRPVVLLDCDGVLADFVGQYLRYLERYAVPGFRIERERIDRFKIEDTDAFAEAARQQYGHGAEGVAKLKQRMRDLVASKLFVRETDVLPGAEAGVNALREVADVRCVTAPWHSSRHWMHERTRWLVEEMGFDRDHIVHATDKRLAHADFLVDDRVSNVERWPHGTPVLWDQPYNRSAQVERPVVRCASWGHLLAMVRAHEKAAPP
jgi:5'(3')-deoxyribonucleotidase